MATLSDSSGASRMRAPSRLGDLVFGGMTRLAAIVTLLLLGGIIISLIISSWPTIQKFGLSFLWNSEWDPPSDIYGALVPIYGTLVTSLIALIIAVPVSFGIALFLTELSPAWLRRPLGTAIELLAAVPSIVYGMWGLLVFAPIFGEYFQKPLAATVGKIPVVGALFQGAPIGIGLLCAGVILAIMIIPYISAVMRDVFEVTPALLKESAYGLGATTWEVMFKVVLPYTRAGVVGGIMLGLGRALGETMAVTFVIGNAYTISAALLEPGTSIASTIANEFAEATDPLHKGSLLLLGFTLFVLTFIVLAIARLMLRQLAKREGN